MNENEEFEFRLRAEQESAPRPKAEASPDFGKKVAPYYLGPAGPARAVMDFGEWLGGKAYQAGGKVTDVATEMGASPEVAAGAGTAANVAVNAIPSFISGSGLARIGKPVADFTARSFMTSALKPPKASVIKGDAERAINTMLDYGINVSKGGKSAVKEAVVGIDDAISNVLANSPTTVDKAQVIKAIRPVVDQVKMELGAAKNLQEVGQAIGTFWNHPLLRQSRVMPAELAHKMKQSFYKELSEKAYGPGAQKLTAYDKTEKAMARGLREQVGKAEPAVSPMLKQQADLTNVLKLLENRLPTEFNKNPGGLSLLAENKLAALAFMIDRSAAAKSMLARGIHTGSPNALRLTGAGGTAQYLGEE